MSFWAGSATTAALSCPSGENRIATLTRDQVEELIDQLRASERELASLEEEAPLVSDALARAAEDLRAPEGSLDEAERRIVALWTSVEGSPLVRAAIARRKRFDPAGTPSAQQEVVLPELDRAFIMINDYVEKILEEGPESADPAGQRP